MKKSIISIFVILLLILLIVFVYILTKDNNQLSVVKGVWLADKTQYVYIIKYENQSKSRKSDFNERPEHRLSTVNWWSNNCISIC